MAIKIDRVGELLEGFKKNQRVLITPEGVPLNIQVASKEARIAAFLLDLFFIFLILIALVVLLLLLSFAGAPLSLAFTLFAFLVFLVSNFYFLHFELAWQGRTPGKHICNLKVINRKGGELTPAAVIARNLTRQVEFFLPLSLFFAIGDGSSGGWQRLCLFGWALALTLLPFFGKDYLRAGDLIGGTMVIAMPKRDLAGDLTIASPQAAAQSAYTFTHEQLAIYGAFELQVLEEFLRRPNTPDTGQLLNSVCDKIRLKINWPELIPAHDVRRFLTDFYSAERDHLERGQLLGQAKADKGSTAMRSNQNKPKK